MPGLEKFSAGEAAVHRDELVGEIAAAPKEARKEILNAARRTPDYWDARTQGLKGRQEGNSENEEVIDDGLALLIRHKTLYHGTADAGITEFIDKEDGAMGRRRTLGDGVYLTTEGRDAAGYGNVRAEAEVQSKRNADATPHIYEVSIDNLKLVDFRKLENAQKVLVGFRDFLQKKHDEEVESGKGNRIYENDLLREIIWLNNFIKHPFLLKGLREDDNAEHKDGLVKAGLSFLMSEYCKSLGYDGLIAVEGGEEGNGNHDTYVIFDFKKAKVIKEQKLDKKDNQLAEAA